MRLETITKTYLTYDELDSSQKEKVLDNLRDINVVDIEWYDSDKEDFHTVLGILGFTDIESRFSGFSTQGDGASFRAFFTIPSNGDTLQDRLNKLLDYALTYFGNNIDLKADYLNLDLSEEFKDDISRLYIDQTGRYAHECTMFCDNKQVQEVARSLAARYYINLESTFDYLTSNEAIEETLLSNEYEFDKDTLELA